MLKEMSIEIIRKCPNRCLHCSSSSNELCKEIIPLEVYKTVLFDAKKIGLRTICFSGGEPFLHPDIVQMVNEAYSLGIQSYIYSSGVFMNDDGVREPIPLDILEQITGKVSKIIFNIEAAEEDVYNSIMGTTGCFPLLKESIRRTVQLGIVAEGHFVPNRLNQTQIRQTLEMCSSLGVSKVSFLRLVIHGRALHNIPRLLLSDGELKNVEQELLLIKSQNVYNIRIGVPLLGETDECCCEAARGKLNIRYDGLVFPCEVFKNNKVEPLQNITPDSIYTSSIVDIYEQSEYLKEARNLVALHTACTGDCEKCVGQYYSNK